ncbi:hypothetical protein [Neptunomonas qingdaonensis]|uniref:Uncharacterized protein n=1 Tax=Neptunomonas qingdaonensis TaxID=1045558 RepID=A0A1I2W145_9GAMM|nr:hypothetical protein [Neptunomonas qingdaonensis]SFG95090.1 hypothetical protein SAMN05216175_12142 [Neptunomonas qingdaonensis]
MAKNKARQLISALMGIATLVGILLLLLKLPDILSESQPPVLYSLAEGCDLNNGPCTASQGNKSISVAITPEKISSLVPLVFSVTLTNINAQSVILDLQGKDMFMGINQIKLSPASDGNTWEGTAELAVCTTNTMFWRASILAYPDETSNPEKATFEFEAK